MQFYPYLSDTYAKFRADRVKALLKNANSLNQILAESNYYPVLPEGDYLGDNVQPGYQNFDKPSHELKKAKLGPTIEELANHLDMDSIAFFKTYIEPYQGLDLKTLKRICEVQGAWSSRIVKQHLEFKVAPAEIVGPITIMEWLDVRMASLNIPGLEPIALRRGERPHLQCHYCGSYSDKTGKTFNKKKMFCHLASCPSGTSDPNLHKKGCCYGTWVHKREMFRQKIVRIEQRKNNTQSSITEALLSFCEKEIELISEVIVSPVRFKFRK